MKIQLPNHVLYIINTLNQNGFSAYAVGGCVRDSLCGKTPSDWDITTSARPEQMEGLFDKTLPTGINHGTVTVVLEKNTYEVTTFRQDGLYENHRSPQSVTFTKDLEEDLSRRDFTMNAMAYHPEVGLVDPFNGQTDIKQKLIRCVGNPILRFDEDALRMLRAIRFAAQTGFSVHEDIRKAIKKQAALIQAISAERIRDELVKTLVSEHPELFSMLYETGLLEYIIPELSRCFTTTQNTKYHCYDVGRHSLAVLSHVPPDLSLRLAALLHDVGKPEKKTTDADGTDHFKCHDLASVDLAKNILTRLRFDNKTKEEVLHLIRFHDRRMAATKNSVRRAVSAVGAEHFPNLLSLMRADAMGQHPDFLSASMAHYDKVEAIYHQIIEEGDALTVADLAISGRDLLALGYKGTQIGLLLKQALELVLEQPEQNEKNFLLEHIKKYAETD